MDWTEKYRPQSLQDLVGNGPGVAKLRAWAEAWTRGVPKTRAVILAGQPGVGKTSAALALARDMGWAVIELNASDARNAERIKRVATAGALHQTFADDGSFHATTDAEAGRKLIILDEADNLYERMDSESAGLGDLSDRGGKRQIIDTIRETKQPIVLIVNDLYALQKGTGAALKSLCETIKFQKVNVRSIPKALQRIAKEEQILVHPKVIEALAEKSGGDLRAAVRDMETLCWGKKEVTPADLAALGPRDVTGNMFDLVRHILKGRSVAELRREVHSVDATPEDIVLWVDENMPKEFKHPEDLVRGYEALSRADIFLGRTRRRQNYRLWAYASDLATAGVMTAKEHDVKTGFVPFGFPQYLMKMSRSRGARQTSDALAGALGAASHTSKRKTRQELVPLFQTLFREDREFAVEQTWRLELADDMVAVLLDEKINSSAVKEIRKAVEALEAEAGPPPPQGLAWGEGDAAPSRGRQADAGRDAVGAEAADGEATGADGGDASTDGKAQPGDEAPPDDPSTSGGDDGSGEGKRDRGGAEKEGQKTLFGY